jgi:hypothetical protein
MTRVAGLIALAMLSSCYALVDFGGLSGGTTVGADGGPGAGSPDGGTSVGTETSSVRLLTKNIYGPPSASFPIEYAGGGTGLELRFVDASNRVAHASPVGAPSGAGNGSVTLPATAGIYSVELRNAAGGISFGQATVSHAVSTFTSAQRTTTPSFGPYAVWPETSLVVGDFSGDGRPDLILASGTDGSGALSGEGIYPYTSSGTILAAGTPTALPGRRICAMKLIDANGDGAADLVFADERANLNVMDVCVVTNKAGIGSAPNCITIDATGAGRPSCIGGIAVGDFDRDGRTDVVVAGGRVSSSSWTEKTLFFFRNGPTAVLASAGFVSLPSTAPYQSIASGDLDDDGRLDLVANGGAPSRVHPFIATTQGFVFSPPTLVAPAHGDYAYDQLTLAYLNADGKPDILLTHPDGPSSVLHSTGNTYTAAAIPTFAEQHGARFAVLDPNVDGVLDVFIPYKNRLLANNTIGALRKTLPTLLDSVSPSTQNSIFGAATLASWSYATPAFADFDADGKIDVLLFSAATLQFEVLKGN